MKAFLKENSVLVISLSLPLILVILFSVVQLSSNLGVDAPKYSVIFMTGTNHSNAGYRVYIKNDKIHYAYQAPTKSQNNYSNYESRKPRVFIYDPINITRKELKTPNTNDYENNMDIILEDVPNGIILTSIESPDGYTLETDYHRNGNIFSGIFGGYNNRSSHYNLSLRKNSKRVAVPTVNNSNNNYYYRKASFLGWITKD